jgi:hypothetical protein
MSDGKFKAICSQPPVLMVDGKTEQSVIKRMKEDLVRIYTPTEDIKYIEIEI